MTEKLELKSCHEAIDTVDVVNIESVFHGKPTDPDILTVVMKNGKRLYCDEVCPMREEPVSEDLEKAGKEWLTPQLDKSYADYGETKMMELTRFDGYAILDAIEFGAQWQKEKDESITEDLGEYINELSKQFPEVSFAKLSRIAVRVAKWQKEHLWKTADGGDFPELERDVVVLVDNFGKLIPKLAKRTYHLIENFVDEDTGEIISMEHTDKVGDVINWTEPAVYWLDVDLPKLQED